MYEMEILLLIEKIFQFFRIKNVLLKRIEYSRLFLKKTIKSKNNGVYYLFESQIVNLHLTRYLKEKQKK